MKKIKRILCVVLLIGLPLSISAPNSYAGTSLSAITNESIKQKQDQISQSQQLKKQLQANINSAKAKKKELEGLKSDVLNYIQKVDAELSAIQEKIEEYYKNGDVITVTPSNAARLWMSNGNALSVTVISDGESYPLEIGKAGQVKVEDVKWIRDTDGRYRLVVVDLD